MDVSLYIQDVWLLLRESHFLQQQKWNFSQWKWYFLIWGTVELVLFALVLILPFWPLASSIYILIDYIVYIETGRIWNHVKQNFSMRVQ